MVLLLALLTLIGAFLLPYGVMRKIAAPRFIMPGPHGYRDFILPPLAVIGLAAFLVALYLHALPLGLIGLAVLGVSSGLWYGIYRALGW